jgi:MoxR-like ATPase
LEGTSPLPETQLDRFLLRLKIGSPSAQEEGEILERFGAGDPLLGLRPVSSPEEVLTVQQERREIRVERTIRDDVIAVSAATRRSRWVPARAPRPGSTRRPRPGQALPAAPGSRRRRSGSV